MCFSLLCCKRQDRYFLATRHATHQLPVKKRRPNVFFGLNDLLMLIFISRGLPQLEGGHEEEVWPGCLQRTPRKGQGRLIETYIFILEKCTVDVRFKKTDTVFPIWMLGL